MNTNALAPYLIFLVAFIVLGAVQYGYHISELNTPKTVMSCQEAPQVIPPEGLEPQFGDMIPPDLYSLGSAARSEWGTVACIPMNDADFSLVTSIFTLGGLAGSLSASKLADSFGRRGATLISSLLLLVGPVVMSFASTRDMLVVGRTVVGLGSGMTTVIVPMYLAEIAPVDLRGVIGVLNQMGIVFGILFGQIQGLYLSTLAGWRWILLTGALFSAMQLALFMFAVESPRYLASRPGGFGKAKKALLRLRGKADVDAEIHSWNAEQHDEARQGLMEDEEADIDGSSPPPNAFPAQDKSSTVSIFTFLTSPVYRRPLAVVLVVQMVQQLTGINATMYYSVTILADVLPTSAKYIGVVISVVNVLATFIPVYMIERTGRRSLLLASVGCMGASSLLLCVGITLRIGILSSFAILAVVASFALGLGPIPFLIIPEVVDMRAVAAAQSLGLAVNWASNFLVGYFFLQIKEYIGAKVFLIFVGFSVLGFILIRLVVPETRGKSIEQVWSTNTAERTD